MANRLLEEALERVEAQIEDELVQIRYHELLAAQHTEALRLRMLERNRIKDSLKIFFSKNGDDKLTRLT